MKKRIIAYLISFAYSGFVLWLIGKALKFI